MKLKMSNPSFVWWIRTSVSITVFQCCSEKCAWGRRHGNPTSELWKGASLGNNEGIDQSNLVAGGDDFPFPNASPFQLLHKNKENLQPSPLSFHAPSTHCHVFTSLFRSQELFLTAVDSKKLLCNLSVYRPSALTSIICIFIYIWIYMFSVSTACSPLGFLALERDDLFNIYKDLTDCTALSENCAKHGRNFWTAGAAELTDDGESH